MLEWTQAGAGTRLMMLVRHDDAAREWAYHAQSKIGTFSDALLALAKQNGWSGQHEEGLAADLPLRAQVTALRR